MERKLRIVQYGCAWLHHDGRDTEQLLSPEGPQSPRKADRDPSRAPIASNPGTTRSISAASCFHLSGLGGVLV